MPWKTLDDMELTGKVVLTRVDINVPIEGGRVTDRTRIDKIVPTVEDIIAIQMTQLMPSGAYPIRPQLQQLVYAAIDD